MIAPTTLEQELEQAATALSGNVYTSHADADVLVARLRARKALVKELERAGYSTLQSYSQGWKDAWRAITGAISSPEGAKE